MSLTIVRVLINHINFATVSRVKNAYVTGLTYRKKLQRFSSKSSKLRCKISHLGLDGKKRAHIQPPLCKSYNHFRRAVIAQLKKYTTPTFFVFQNYPLKFFSIKMVFINTT